MSSDGTKHPGIVPDNAGALLREVQGWEEYSTKRVPHGARGKTDKTRMGAQYAAVVCQVVPAGRVRTMMGRLHSLVRGRPGPRTGRELCCVQGSVQAALRYRRGDKQPLLGGHVLPEE
jgi:hypothetical protein